MGIKAEEAMTERIYDFPCSYTFRAYEALQNEGIELPLLREEPQQPEVPDVVPTPWQLTQLLEQMQQLRGVIKWLENKLNDHIDKSKRRRGQY